MKRWMKPAVIGLALLITLSFAVYEITRSRAFQFFGGIVTHVNTDKKMIALTFDDGPTERTGEVLAVLDEAGIKATFFLVGQSIGQYPDEAARIAAAGHELGNHSWSHHRMVIRSLSFIGKEIEQTDTLIRAAGYEGEIQFRPPYGKKLVLLPYYLHQHGRKTILWDLEPNSIPEVDASSENVVEYVVENAKPGSIILLHVMVDGKGASIGAIKGIAEGLHEKGYEFVTLSKLLSYNTK